MTHIRRLILAFVLSCGLVPAFAQAPAPVPALPDSERRTTYSISATTCACNVNFALYGDGTDYQNWVEVWLNGVQLQYNDATFGWKVTSPTGALTSIARPITDAVLTFNSAQTGTVQIVGARRPRRVAQFSESRGVAARDLNQALTDIIAQNRETWDKNNDVTGRLVLAPPGETMPVLPALALRANKGACFDSNGYLQPCTAIPSSTTFIAGNGIQFSGSNPTTITNNILAGQSIGITGTNPLTVSLLSNALNFLLNTTCVATPSTCVTLLGYANPIWYGADPTGAADSATAINNAIAGSKLVSMSPGGTYKIASSIKLVANQRFTCNGSTITQGNSVNLAIFVDVFTNTPNGAQFDHCTVDGNRANNTNINTILVDVSGVNNVTVSYNSLINSSGGAIGSSNTVYLVAEQNYIANCIAYGISSFNTSAGVRSYLDIHNNTIIGPMLHLIQLDQIDGNNISFNKLIQGSAVGSPAVPMRINVASSTATWVSGPDFTGITLGSVLVVNGGTEYPITAIGGPTSLTLSGTGSLSSVLASWGGGDVLSLTSTSYNTVQGNFISGGVTGGIVLSQFGGNISSSESSVGNIINGNFVENSGQFGIALEAVTAAGSPIVGVTEVTSNIVIAPGRAGGGIAPVGIQLFAATSGLMPGLVIDGNYVYDPFAVTGGFWLSGSGSANATNVKFGNSNIQQGFVNGGNMSGYPTFASLPIMRGEVYSIIDGLAASCGDSACTTWGTTVTAGGGALKLALTYNGTNYTLIGK